MAGPAKALPLQQVITSLDKNHLPKILQVCSGVYYQGSIYEISGTDVCLSTGDLIKVIDIELSSVICEDISNNKTFELPINHRGLFKMVPGDIPYHTVEEMINLRPVGLDSCLPFSFISRHELTIDSLTLTAGTEVTALSVEKVEGDEDWLGCRLAEHQGASAEVQIPFSFRGEFYECESDKLHTLKEIMSSPSMLACRFRLNNATTHSGPLALRPVHQVKALMRLRKGVVTFSSSLEVEVVDVTEQSKEIPFLTLLSLEEVLSQPDEIFPTMAEILEDPGNHGFFRTSWLPAIKKGCKLVLHGKRNSTMVLASCKKGRKAQEFFLINQQYSGQFRRSPREFRSVYELHVAFAQTPSFTVSVTSNSEEQEDDGLPALSVGDQLEVVRYEKVGSACGDLRGQTTTEVLVCRLLRNLAENADEEEEIETNENEELLLPLYMQCHFVEKMTDNKKYRLKNLVENLILPATVKVVSRESNLETDPLCGITFLRLEGVTLEPNIQVSLPRSPECCFGIPTRWLSMNICLTKDPLPWPKEQPPEFQVVKVTEVTHSFYYEFCKQTCPDEPPPPLPPKPNLPTASKSPKERSPKKIPKHRTGSPSNSLTKHVSDTSITCQRRPAAPPPLVTSHESSPPVISRKHMPDMKSGKALPNTYAKVNTSI